MKTSLAISLAAATLAVSADDSLAARKRILGGNVQWRVLAKNHEYGREAPNAVNDFLVVEEELGRFLEVFSMSMSMSMPMDPLPAPRTTASESDDATDDGVAKATPRNADPRPKTTVSNARDGDDGNQGGKEVEQVNAVATDVSDGGLTVDDVDAVADETNTDDKTEGHEGNSPEDETEGANNNASDEAESPSGNAAPDSSGRSAPASSASKAMLSVAAAFVGAASLSII